MFFPKAMSEIELIVPSKDLIEVMRVLGGRGVFHQVDGASATAGAQTGSDNTWQERAASYAALERRIQSLMQILGIEQPRPKGGSPRDVTRKPRRQHR